MIGPAVRAGIFEQQTEDPEAVSATPASSLSAAVSAAFQILPAQLTIPFSGSCFGTFS
jgi:hypothetical protein